MKNQSLKILYSEQVTPEAYMDVIDALRPDIFVPLVDDIPSTSGRKRVKQSVDRSLKWLDECIERNVSRKCTPGVQSG